MRQDEKRMMFKKRLEEDLSLKQAAMQVLDSDDFQKAIQQQTNVDQIQDAKQILLKKCLEEDPSLKQTAMQVLVSDDFQKDIKQQTNMDQIQDEKRMMFKKCLEEASTFNFDALVRHYSLRYFLDLIEKRYVDNWTGSFPEQAIFVHLQTEHRFEYLGKNLGILKLSKRVASIKTESPSKDTKPYWFMEFKFFCYSIKELAVVEDCLRSDFGICNASVLACFFQKTLGKAENIAKLHEIIKEIGDNVAYFNESQNESVINGQNIKNLQIVKQYFLIKEYRNHCGNFGSSMENCDPIYIIVFLSQIMARSEATKKDMEWTLLAISDLYFNVNGEPLKSDQKIVDFFKAINIWLPNRNINHLNSKACEETEVQLDSLKYEVCEEKEDEPLLEHRASKVCEESVDEPLAKRRASRAFEIRDVEPLAKRRASKVCEEEEDPLAKNRTSVCEKEDGPLAKSIATKLCCAQHI